MVAASLCHSAWGRISLPQCACSSNAWRRWRQPLRSAKQKNCWAQPTPLEATVEDCGGSTDWGLKRKARKLQGSDGLKTSLICIAWSEESRFQTVCRLVCRGISWSFGSCIGAASGCLRLAANPSSKCHSAFGDKAWSPHHCLCAVTFL